MCRPRDLKVQSTVSKLAYLQEVHWTSIGSCCTSRQDIMKSHTIYMIVIRCSMEMSLRYYRAQLKTPDNPLYANRPMHAMLIVSCVHKRMACTRSRRRDCHCDDHVVLEAASARWSHNIISIYHRTLIVCGPQPVLAQSFLFPLES